MNTAFQAAKAVNIHLMNLLNNPRFRAVIDSYPEATWQGFVPNYYFPQDIPFHKRKFGVLLNVTIEGSGGIEGIDLLDYAMTQVDPKHYTIDETVAVGRVDGCWILVRFRVNQKLTNEERDLLIRTGKITQQFSDAYETISCEF